MIYSDHLAAILPTCFARREGRKGRRDLENRPFFHFLSSFLLLIEEKNIFRFDEEFRREAKEQRNPGNRMIRDAWKRVKN